MSINALIEKNMIWTESKR